MTEINNKGTFDKFEREKICNLLQSSSLELETIIKNADKIFVLEKGQIVESGTHNELSKIKNGTYKKLCELQFQA